MFIHYFILKHLPMPVCYSKRDRKVLMLAETTRAEQSTIGIIPSVPDSKRSQQSSELPCWCGIL